MKRSPLFSLLSLVLCSSIGFAQKDLIVVDRNNGPGTNYTGVRAAILAANDGDVLLVRNSAYGTATIDGKSLAIISEDPHGSYIGTLIVQNLGPTQSVTLRGIDGDELDVIDCAGSTLLEEADFFSAVITNSDSVVLRSTSFTANFFVPKNGITAVNSDLYVYDSLVMGKDGINFEDGNHAFHLTDSKLLLHGSTAEGGDGYYEPALGGFIFAPASGIYATGPNSKVSLLDSTVKAGTKAPNSGNPPPPDIELVSGATVAQLPGSARLVQSGSPIREGEVASIDYIGEPGDAVWLAISRSAGKSRFFAPGYYHGFLPLLSLTRAGTIPASGVLTMSFTVPNLPSAIEVHALHLTAYVVDGNGKGFLSGPTMVHALDSSL